MDRLVYRNIYGAIYVVLHRQMAPDTMSLALPTQESETLFLVIFSSQTSHAQHNDDEKSFEKKLRYIDEEGKI